MNVVLRLTFKTSFGKCDFKVGKNWFGDYIEKYTIDVIFFLPG